MNKTTRMLVGAAGPAAVLTGLAAAAVGALPTTASASAVCFGAYRTHVVDTRLSAQITCVFTYTGAEQRFMVPRGVTSATVDLIGARGGNGWAADDTGYGGDGGEVTGQIPASPGTWLYIEVGGTGHNSTYPNGGAGGWNGGAAGGGGYGGGGGGGASDIRTISVNDSGTTMGSRLLVAPGGGGGGGTGSCGNGGGNGGDLTGPADDGNNCGGGPEHGGQGGGPLDPWTAGAGGADGSSSGTPGTNGGTGAAGLGGAGGYSSGGGGGGGFTGGGGGGGGAHYSGNWGAGGGGEAGIPGSNDNSVVKWDFHGPTSAPAAVSLTFHELMSQPRTHHGHSAPDRPAVTADRASSSLQMPARRP